MKKPKINKLKTAIVVQALIIGLLITTLAYVYAQSGTTFTISQGAFPGAPSYTIWREGSNYYAKNTYGLIEYSGTNASQIIQNTVVNNRTLFLKAGTYELDAYLSFQGIKNLVMVGEGSSTILKQADNAEITDVISIWQPENDANIIIKDIVLDGNQANNPSTETVGIYVGTSGTSNVIEGIKIDNVIFRDFRGICLKVKNLYGGQIVNNKFESSLKRGINALYSRYLTIANNHFNDCGTAIETQIVYDTIISDNIVYPSDNETGIWTRDDNNRNIIRGNVVRGRNPDYNGGKGIVVHNTSLGVEVSTNTVVNFDIGIYASGIDLMIVNNYVQTTLRDGINVENSEGVLIQGNLVADAGYNGINADGDVGEKRARIIGNRIVSSGRHGLIVNTPDSIVSANEIKSSGINQSDTYDGIYIATTNVILSGNRVWDSQASPTQRWGIYEDTGADYNIIIGCNTRNYGVTGGIKVIGTNTKVNLCWNGTTWIP